MLLLLWPVQRFIRGPTCFIRAFMQLPCGLQYRFWDSLRRLPLMQLELGGLLEHYEDRYELYRQLHPHLSDLLPKL